MYRASLISETDESIIYPSEKAPFGFEEWR